MTTQQQQASLKRPQFNFSFSYQVGKDSEFLLPYFNFRKRNIKFVDKLAFQQGFEWDSYKRSQPFLQKSYCRIKYAKDCKISFTSNFPQKHLKWLASIFHRKKSYKDYYPILKSFGILYKNNEEQPYYQVQIYDGDKEIDIGESKLISSLRSKRIYIRIINEYISEDFEVEKPIMRLRDLTLGSKPVFVARVNDFFYKEELIDLIDRIEFNTWSEIRYRIVYGQCITRWKEKHQENLDKFLQTTSPLLGLIDTIVIPKENLLRNLSDKSELLKKLRAIQYFDTLENNNCYAQQLDLNRFSQLQEIYVRFQFLSVEPFGAILQNFKLPQTLQQLQIFFDFDFDDGITEEQSKILTNLKLNGQFFSSLKAIQTLEIVKINLKFQIFEIIPAEFLDNFMYSFILPSLKCFELITTAVKVNLITLIKSLSEAQQLEQLFILGSFSEIQNQSLAILANLKPFDYLREVEIPEMAFCNISLYFVISFLKLLNPKKLASFRVLQEIQECQDYEILLLFQEISRFHSLKELKLRLVEKSGGQKQIQPDFMILPAIMKSLQPIGIRLTTLSLQIQTDRNKTQIENFMRKELIPLLSFKIFHYNIEINNIELQAYPFFACNVVRK